MSREIQNDSYELSSGEISKIENLTYEILDLLSEIKKSKKPNPTLRPEMIKSKLNPAIIEEIFREYAHKIKIDGEIKKSNNSISKGSLNMDLFEGKWHRFSDGSGGDIIRFIERAQNGSYLEAIHILADKVGIKIPRPKSFYSYLGNSKKNDASDYKCRKNLIGIGHKDISSITKKGKEEWEPVGTVPANATAFNPERDLAFMLNQKGVEIDEIYEYRNIAKNLIGYTIRTIETKIDKETGEVRKVKQVKPVSYCYNASKSSFRWQLKGFLDDGHKPIYRAEILSDIPQRPILIVEGEKTANVAAALLPDYKVISWLGGAQVISKVNWEHIKDRKVVIWPDNDEAGIMAAEQIISELEAINKKKDLVKRVWVEDLGLPQKWDLADDIPSHLSKDKIKTILDMLIG